MTKEQIDSILADTGISFNTKRKAVVAGEPITDAVANAMLKKHNTTVDDLRKAINELNKKVAAENIPNDLRYGDRISDTKVKSPAFAKYVDWNIIDEKIFGYFQVARSSEGGGLMLLISNHDTQFRCLALSSNVTQNLNDISEACSKITIKGDDGQTVTLYDHILRRYEIIMDRAMEVYKKRNAIEFGEWAIKNGLPSMMINNFSLIANQEEKDVENENGQHVTMYRVHALYFGTEKGGKEFPLDCIAKHFDTLAGIPSRHAKIPRLYSNDFSEPALYHIDLDSIAKKGEHPTWDKYLARFRTDEGKVIKAFTWSIFKADNTGRQMLYFYDPDGFSGKSVFEKAITSGLGESLVAALQKDSLNNQFSMAKVWDKRLVVIDDNKNPNLIRSEKMHMILGSGLADVEAKGKNSFMYKMQCKVIASGNCRLQIDPSANHERTRVIVVEPHVTDDMLKEFAVCDKNGNVKRNKYGRVQLIGDATFEANLIKEFSAFLYDCKEAYEELCPKDSSIIISEEMEDALESLSDDTFDLLDDLIEENFEFDDASSAISVKDFTALIDDMKYELLESLSKKEVESIEREDIIQHMMKRYKIQKKPARVQGIVKKCYVGVSSRKQKEVNRAVISEVDKANQRMGDADSYGLFSSENMKDVN